MSSPRAYQSEADLLRMLDLLMQARTQTSDWRYAHVGELIFNFFMVFCHLNPKEHIRLWQAENGDLAGFAILGEDPLIDWQVLPEYEWRGIESEAIAWAESRLAELRSEDADFWGGKLVSGARQDNTRRIAFLEEHGFRYAGEFAEVNMLRSLDEPIPGANLPSGCLVSSMSDIDDITNRAGAQREVWHPWSVGKISDEDYRQFMRLPGYIPELDIVAIAPDGVIAAYLNSWIDPLNRIGDFGPVGARRAYRRQGFTRAVLLEGLRRMKAHGMNRVCVSTGINNTPAINLYESVGFHIVNRYLDFVRSE